MAFRDEFPVLERVAYLNAGTDGPIPRAAVELVQRGARGRARGRADVAALQRRRELTDELRAGYAQLMDCEPDDVAVTSGTSFGLGSVLAGMDLGPGDEIVTSDAEHPGLLGPLIAARHRGATVREVPFAELANAVRATTTLVAASHVNWITGEVAPDRSGRVHVPVILDGAQGSGAVPVDVAGARLRRLRRRRPEMAVRRRRHRDALGRPRVRRAGADDRPTYGSFEDASRGLESTLRAGGRRFDSPLAARGVAFSLAALRSPASPPTSTRDGAGRRSRRAASPTALSDAGYTVAARGRRTLVSFEYPDPRQRASGSRRPGSPCATCPGIRTCALSVGAWNDESDLERLLAAL